MSTASEFNEWAENNLVDVAYNSSVCLKVWLAAHEKAGNRTSEIAMLKVQISDIEATFATARSAFWNLLESLKISIEDDDAEQALNEIIEALGE